jgi:dTDP-4-dehydrorhamnose reductase
MIKKILILGITGTLGHKIAQELIKNKRLIIYGTYNQKKKYLRIKTHINIAKFYRTPDIKSILSLIKSNKFDYVVNCIGQIKQKKNIKSKYFELNKKLPLAIAKLSILQNFKMIHFSTDCVFDGKKGNYKEDDFKNAKDYYGISKGEGEPLQKNNKNCLVLRTSFIGHEIFGSYSLLNWLLNSEIKIYGFNKCLYNGLTNVEVAKIIHKIIINKHFINGLFNLSGRKISKYSLLKIISKVYSLNKKIEKKEIPEINRTLNNSKFKKFFLYRPKKWNDLIRNLYTDYLLNKSLYNVK